MYPNKRSCPIFISSVHLGAMIQKQPDQTDIALASRPDQACAVMKTPNIDVSSILKQNLCYLGVANIAGPEEGGPGVGVLGLHSAPLLN